MGLFLNIYRGVLSADEIPDDLKGYIERVGSGLATDTLDKIIHGDEVCNSSSFESLDALEVEFELSKLRN